MTMERHKKPAPLPIEDPGAGEIGELSEEDKASICAAIDAAFAKPARDNLTRLSAELGPQFDAWFRERGHDPGGYTEQRTG